MNHPTYLPEPGGDLVLYVTIHAIALVHLHGDQARRVLRLPVEDSGLPREFLARFHAAFETYQPSRLVVSVAAPAPPTHILAVLTVVARDLVRPGHVSIVEVPDVLRIADAIRAGGADTPASAAPPSRPPGPTPLLGWHPAPGLGRVQCTIEDFIRAPVCA